MSKNDAGFILFYSYCQQIMLKKTKINKVSLHFLTP